ncbi:hypothetical protein ACQB60_22420 [Actinomycetota bacterium Odt1-20B]
MDLTPYVNHLREELAVAAAAGGDEARELADRLTAPLESASRLVLLNALSTAMDEITLELAPGSVDVRLRGLDPQFVVTPPPAAEPYEEVVAQAGAALAPQAASQVAPAAPFEGDEGATSRINFRLPAPLKARVEEAANQSGLSVNAWMVRAVSEALAPAAGPSGPAPRHRGAGAKGFTGWVH